MRNHISMFPLFEERAWDKYKDGNMVGKNNRFSCFKFLAPIHIVKYNRYNLLTVRTR
jgi:hypothetical protein